MDDLMTWPRWESLERYWAKFPPISVVASTLVERPSAERPGEFGTMEDLARELGGLPGFDVSGVH